MNIMTAIEAQLNRVMTENGDTAYRSTGNANLDFFGIAGALRHNQKALIGLFYKAMAEDRAMALKNLFYLRDVRNGMGERQSFRSCLQVYAYCYPAEAILLIPFIVAFGRWDDVLVLLDFPALRERVAHMIRAQLLTDDAKNEAGECVSLCAKWMPSVNASSRRTRNLAKMLYKRMGMTEVEYRKLLSRLRKGRIVERHLTERDYSFPYAHVPGRAMRKYRAAFLRNDENRWRAYLDSLSKGEVVAKVRTLFPHEIITPAFANYDLAALSPEEIDLMRAQWQALERTTSQSNTIVVRDGSGSMWGTPLNVATALAILFAEQLQGAFRDRFITFSAEPELVKFPEGADILEKVRICSTYDDCSNTNIEKVYELLLEASQQVQDPAEYIRRVVIISDMEFDYGTDNVPTYESMATRFAEAGVPLPEMVYWNVEARQIHFAAMPEHPNIRFVSGYSGNIIQSILENGSIDGVQFMQDVLERYEDVTMVITDEE